MPEKFWCPEYNMEVELDRHGYCPKCCGVEHDTMERLPVHAKPVVQDLVSTERQERCT